MASIKKRNNKYCVVYRFVDADGKKKQKWESYRTLTEAKTRQKEVEYKERIGTFVIPQCRTLNELLTEYINLYGKNTWALSTYSSNVSTIDNYIRPMIGDMKLKDITPRVLEKYYQQLLKTKAVPNAMTGKAKKEFCTTSTVREVHKLLRNCFNQALKWELVEKNPAMLATVPKHKQEERAIWTAEELFHALDVCEDEQLKLCINLAFSCSLRVGELLGLTWDCVDVSEESIASGYASITVNKEIQRVRKDTLKLLEEKDVLQVFPSQSKRSVTVLVLKAPKTQSSVRKVFLPRTVAQMLVDHKREQDQMREALGDEYADHNLVICSSCGSPRESTVIREQFTKLIEEHDLPKVVFHSLRHSSITYKLKLNGGDVKAVQGDSGHAQTSMVTEVYSHILDDDRRNNARLFEENFYAGKGRTPASPDPGQTAAALTAFVPGTNSPAASGASAPTDMAALLKLLSNPETAAMLQTLVSAINNGKQ